MNKIVLDEHSVECGFMLALNLLLHLGVEVPLYELEETLCHVAEGKGTMLTAGEIISNIAWSHGVEPTEEEARASTSPKAEVLKAENREAAVIVLKLMRR